MCWHCRSIAAMRSQFRWIGASISSALPANCAISSMPRTTSTCARVRRPLFSPRFAALPAVKADQQDRSRYSVTARAQRDLRLAVIESEPDRNFLKAASRKLERMLDIGTVRAAARRLHARTITRHFSILLRCTPRGEDLHVISSSASARQTNER
jgi:hypothetical protein